MLSFTREPGGAPGAEAIRRLLVEGDPARWSAETEILLFNAARRDHLERTIQPALDRGAGGHNRTVSRIRHAFIRAWRAPTCARWWTACTIWSSGSNRT